MKLKVQAQHLQKGDIVGSGETVIEIILASSYDSVILIYRDKARKRRGAKFKKERMINVQRSE